MNSAQIKYFMTVAKYLNFTEAAKSLYVAQSSLSRSISNLEEELGLPLFIRTKKYVRLTPSGAVLLEEFTKIAEQYESALKKAAQADATREGVLRIGIVEAQESENFLPDSINFIKMNYPNINIHLMRGNFRELRESLKKDQIDIAITLEFDIPAYEEQGIAYEPFRESTGQCIISKYHPLAHKESIDLHDLKDDTLIVISPEISEGGYMNLMKLCEEKNFTPKKIKLANSVEDIMLQIESGLGFSVLDANCSIHNNASVRFKTLKDNDRLSLVAIWHKANLNPAIPLFINRLIQPEESV